MSTRSEISNAARAELQRQFVPDVAIDVAEILLGHVIDAADTVAREYDPEAGDDPNLAGINVARRGKNKAALDLRRHPLPEVAVRSVRGFTWDINADGTRLHTYSAPGGLDVFQLVGGDRKAEIVERSVEQLTLFEKSGAKGRPDDLVLAYARNHRGVVRACLGVMKTEIEFAWEVLIYDSEGGEGLGAVPEAPKDHGPSFREQPQERADISLKRPQEKRENL